MPITTQISKVFLATLLMLGLVCVVELGLLHSNGAKIQAQSQFSNASIQGSYSLTVTGGPNIGAAIGVVRADGTGNFNGSGTANIPGSLPNLMERKIFPIEITGTFAVNPDGTGSGAATLVEPGTTAAHTYDFVIAEAEESVATEIHALQREGVKPAGSLVTLVFRRLTD